MNATVINISDEETQASAPVVPDIEHLDLPDPWEMDQETQRRMDAMAAAFGYPEKAISAVFTYAVRCFKGAEHYRLEAERMRDCRVSGRIIERLSAEEAIVEASWHGRLKQDVRLGRTIAVRGPAGNGKSTGVRSILKALGYTIYHMDCTDTTTVEHLIGGLVPVPDGCGGIQMDFRPGLFARAFADRNGAIQLDEFDALDPRTALALQSALHRSFNGKRRWLAIPDHEETGIAAEGDCPIVVTMNTYGSGSTREYVGRNALDIASMDRFNSIIATDYEAEEQIIRKAGFVKAPAARIVAHAKRIRSLIEKNGLRVVLSTRRLLDIAEILQNTKLSFREAFEREFYERLEPQDRKTLAVEEEHDAGKKPVDVHVDMGSLDGGMGKPSPNDFLNWARIQAGFPVPGWVS